MVVSTADAAGQHVLLVLPVTHSQPPAAELAIELPSGTRRRLGLDDAHSWIVTSEYNRFTWPGPDIRPDTSGESILGILPATLVARTIANLRVHATAGRARAAGRD